MNRSFRGTETLMPSIRPRVPQLKSLQSSMMREKEDDLALFLEMRKREKEKTDLLLLHDSDDLDDSLVTTQPGSSPLFNIPTTTPARKTGPDDFLNSDGDKNDYDWLLTPPGTPLFPSLETDARKAYMNEEEAPKAQPTVLRSRLANSQTENTMKNNLVPSTNKKAQTKQTPTKNQNPEPPTQMQIDYQANIFLTFYPSSSSSQFLTITTIKNSPFNPQITPQQTQKCYQ